MDFSGIRLIGLDLDETVFTHDKRITPRTGRAIEAACRAGIYVLPATGRPASGIPSEFTDIPGVRYALCCNGALVMDLETKEFLVHECMDAETAGYVYRSCKALKCITEFYVDGVPYSEKEKLDRADYYFPDPYIRAYVRKTRVPVPDPETFLRSRKSGVEKINLSFPSLEAKDQGLCILKEIPGITCVQGLPTNLELSRADVDKGSGLLRLADRLGIPHEAVLGCGDSQNDLQMIIKCGVGAAVANASEEVKRHADIVLPYTNEEEGVAWLLEQILAALPGRAKL